MLKSVFCQAFLFLFFKGFIRRAVWNVRYGYRKRKEVWETVRTANERREAIRYYLSDVRFVTLKKLTDEFQVSRSTIRRDIDILTETTPLETVQGNGGGIRVIEGWYANRRYLTDTQETLLIRLSAGLRADDRKVMESILIAFGKPKTGMTREKRG